MEVTSPRKNLVKSFNEQAKQWNHLPFAESVIQHEERQQKRYENFAQPEVKFTENPTYTEPDPKNNPRQENAEEKNLASHQMKRQFDTYKEKYELKSILKKPPLMTRVLNFLKDSFDNLLGRKPKGYEVDHFVERPSTFEKGSIDYKKADPPHVGKRDLAEVNREFNKLKVIDMQPKTSKFKFTEDTKTESLGGRKGKIVDAELRDKRKVRLEAEKERSETLSKSDPSSPSKGP